MGHFAASLGMDLEPDHRQAHPEQVPGFDVPGCSEMWGFVKQQSKKPWRGEQRASLRFPWKSNPHRSCLSHKLISGLCEPNNRGQTRLTRSGGDVPGATRCPQPLACGPPGWQLGSTLSPWTIMGSVPLLAQPGCSRSGRI